MNITELAIYRKMFGGGGSPAIVEGTAIPVGETVEKIYFNTNLSIEKVDEYLSQLTYVDIGLGLPVSLIYAQTSDYDTGIFVFVAKGENDYTIHCWTNVSNQIGTWIYSSEHDGVMGEQYIYGDNKIFIPYGQWDITCGEPPISDFMGIPIGLENEKIKNVLSVTPFGASVSSGATAHHLQSVDELPANAKDGSIAIVDTPHGLYGTWEFNNVINNMPYNSWEVVFECDGVTYTTLAAYGTIYYYTPLSEEVMVYESESRWKDVKYQTIKIIEGGNQELQGWLSKDAQRIDAAIAHEVYYRENGSWKYVGTTSEAISAEYY